MKNLLIATVCFVLTTPAMAFSNNAIGNAQPSSGYTRLSCKPPLDHRDPDPVVETYVGITLDNNAREAVDIEVSHTLYTGRQINRAEQYSNGGVSQKTGKNEWYWEGHLFRNTAITMIGRVYLTADGRWFYEERIFHKGYPDVTIQETCVSTYTRD